MDRSDVLVTPSSVRGRASAQSKLELLEGFLLEVDDVVSCSQRAMEWLQVNGGVERALVLVADADRSALVGVAACGLPSGAEQVSIPLLDGRQPLVSAFISQRPTFLRPQRALTGISPLLAALLDEPHVAVPIGGEEASANQSLGLLVASPSVPPLDRDMGWLVATFGRRLDQLTFRGTLAKDERRFRRERALLLTIINAVTDPILLTDTEGRLLVANTPAEILFCAGEDFSEGRRRAVELNNMFFSAALSRTAVDSVEIFRRELLLVDPSDGSDLLFELMSSMVEDSREGTGIVSVLRNITDLRKATKEIEENYLKMRVAEAEARAERDRLDVIIDSVADPILVTDEEGKISMMNAPAERLFTFTSDGAEPAQRIVQANDAHFTSFVAGLLTSGVETRRRGEIALVDPATVQPVPVEASAAKILSELGELTAIVTILHDRTEAIERARLYEQLKQASDELEARVHSATAELAHQNELLRRQAIELEQASLAKSQFLANMSHELRTPLNAVLGYAAMTLQGVSGDLNAAQRKALGRIESNARHLLTIINEILDITRIEAGRMPLQVSTFGVSELLREVLSELEPIVARTTLDIRTRIPPKHPNLTSDRQKVKQILVNLLSNAVKFTHKGSVTIESRYLPRARMFSLSVVDTGIGIAPADQETIFEDFRQVDSTPTRAYGGTGLGLSICRRLATMLRGSIRVESRLGHGSTFVLMVPVRLRK